MRHGNSRLDSVITASRSRIASAISRHSAARNCCALMYFAAETNAPGRMRLRVSAAKSSGRSCMSRSWMA